MLSNANRKLKSIKKYRTLKQRAINGHGNGQEFQRNKFSRSDALYMAKPITHEKTTEK